MENEQHLREKEKERVENYLADVVKRLMDVTGSLEALYVVVTHEKRALIQNGQAFAYQQGILDVVTELRDYATGKRDLQGEKEKLKKDILEELKEDLVEEVERRESECEVEGYI